MSADTSHASKMESMHENAKVTGTGLARFLDRFLCGRDNHHLYHTCLGLGAMHIGLPDFFPEEVASAADQGSSAAAQTVAIPAIKWSLPMAVINNRSFPQELANPTINPLEAMGMSHPPTYPETISSTLELPDLPYNDAAHFLCISNGVYDTGKKFVELWNDPKMHYNIFSVLTSKQFIGTGLPHAVSISVMTLLHPLGALIAIPMGHVCGQLVASALKVMLGDPHEIRKVKDSPLMSDIMVEAGILRKALKGENPSGHPSMKVSLVDPKVLRPNESNAVTFQLREPDGAILTDQAMKAAQGMVHLFIIDEGLTDCYHIHPHVTSADGKCHFVFTPKLDHAYRMFVDYQVLGKESEMIYTDLPTRKKMLPAPVIQTKEADIHTNYQERLAFGVA